MLLAWSFTVVIKSYPVDPYNIPGIALRHQNQHHYQTFFNKPHSNTAFQQLRFLQTDIMNVNKKLGRFKQWAGERMGGEVKTNTSDDFKALEAEMTVRQEGMSTIPTLSQIRA